MLQIGWGELGCLFDLCVHVCLRVEACKRKLGEGEIRAACIDEAKKNIREGNLFYSDTFSKDVQVQVDFCLGVSIF